MSKNMYTEDLEMIKYCKNCSNIRRKYLFDVFVKDTEIDTIENFSMGEKESFIKTTVLCVCDNCGYEMRKTLFIPITTKWLRKIVKYSIKNCDTKEED